MSIWLAQHWAAMRDACRRLATAPLNSLLSLLVIGIALTLPTAGWLLIDNLRALTGDSPGVQQISVFLSLDAGKREIAEIENRLQAGKIGRWRFVAREEALKRLQAAEGMADIVASLPRNPLPDAFVVTPSESQPAELERLAKTFAGWPRVAHVQLDSAWVKRFDALLRLGRLVVMLLGVLFAAALVTITFNTIRLQILAQAAEIEVARLIGATDAYIQRPLHYFGMLQGALGGLCATLLVAVGFHLLTPLVAELTQLYGTNFTLRGLGAGHVAFLAAIGAALGWLGAWISALMHLRRFA
ncbi:permease-like cell division protein FtsX [Accumulibacter sp.]|uniref:permease-like cell division protein FtsX n=1 Tax=Accumulibacter sp. TaxID=2053492 RepID=UPI0025D30900|nr:permease-like cell division protein FtsX [Accumulibacter sp.]MCM8612515.1 permease-like cell division protein FtsX [Accumulibacter sp.]MCM8634868.1 permease-like cell division protein FtsX [Accumulibacter sp.]MCM8638519.1 permease-like cell division protein FtsX [Accumulibacter sp.]